MIFWWIRELERLYDDPDWSRHVFLYRTDSVSQLQARIQKTIVKEDKSNEGQYKVKDEGIANWLNSTEIYTSMLPICLIWSPPVSAITISSFEDSACDRALHALNFLRTLNQSLIGKGWKYAEVSNDAEAHQARRRTKVSHATLIRKYVGLSLDV